MTKEWRTREHAGYPLDKGLGETGASSIGRLGTWHFSLRPYAAPVLPWFQTGAFPLYLAPMAGVTDVVFRQICKELGADVMVTEFVSAEGIMQADERTRKYTEFNDEQRPVGVQLFGGDGERMGEAAKKIIGWKQPDFIPSLKMN